MKGFIEVTTDDGQKNIINVAHIVWFFPVFKGKKTCLALAEFPRFIVNESYDELKAIIAKAVQQ